MWLVNGLIVLVVLLAAGGAVVALTSSRGGDDGLRTTPVGRGTVAETVTASGAVTSARSSTLNFAAGGRIDEVLVAVGDRVEAGDVVATLDAEYADANLDAARAQRDAAREQLEDAREARDDPPATATPAPTQPAAPPAAGTGAGGAPGGQGQGTAASTGTTPCPTCAPPPCGTCPPPTTTQPATGDTRQDHQPARRDAPLVGVHGFSARAPKAAASSTPAPPGGGGAGGTGTGTGAAAGTGTGVAGGTGAAGGAGAASSPETAVAQAEASLAQAEAAVIQAEQATEDLELASPQDGTVVSLDAGPGQLVPAGGTVTSSTSSGNPTGGTLPDGTAAGGAGAAGAAASAAAGAAGAPGAGGAAGGVTGGPTAPAVMTILDLTALQIRADVPELDVGRLQVGQPVEVTVNALPGQALPGTVTAVDLLPGSGTSVQYGTVVTLSGPPPNLRPGMSASVAVTVAQSPNVSFLPSVAVTPIGGEGATAGTVRVLGPDGVPQDRTVALGLSSDTLTEIRSGLAPGELVVLPDPNTANVFGPGQGPPPNLEGGGSGGAGGSGGG